MSVLYIIEYLCVLRVEDKVKLSLDASFDNM
jgi:hypothetical protein